MSFRSRSQRGSALVEFALAAPLGILALAGTFQFGYAVSKPLLAAAGEGAILAGQAEPHRECSMAVSGGSVAWCREQAFRPSGGDFQGIGVYRSDGCLGERRGTRLRAPVIVSMSPPG